MVAEIAQDCAGIRLSAKRAHEAAERRFQHVQSPRKSLLREMGGNYAALGGASGMEALGHGARPRGVEAGRLRAANSQGVRALL